MKIDIIKAFTVKLTSVTGSFENVRVNKTCLPTNVFDGVNTPVSCISATEINDIEKSGLNTLYDVTKFCLARYLNKCTPSASITKYHCFVNPIIQTLFSILRTIGHTFYLIPIEKVPLQSV